MTCVGAGFTHQVTGGVSLVQQRPKHSILITALAEMAQFWNACHSLSTSLTPNKRYKSQYTFLLTWKYKFRLEVSQEFVVLKWRPPIQQELQARRMVLILNDKK